MVISYTVDLFADLITAYPTWEELRAYLESEQGGGLRMVDSRERLVLIRYQKGVSNMDLPHIRWFRSVIWDTVINRPVSVAPPRCSTSSPWDAPPDTRFACEEFMDGFMIQCFRDYAQPETVKIATRSKLDASGTFYSTRSFRELFLEAYRLDKVILPEVQGVSFSYLVQHKENRIVAPVAVNQIYLVQTVNIDPVTGRMHVLDHTHEIPTIDGFLRADGSLAWNEADFLARVRTLCAERSWAFQGIVLKDSIGNRWKFCSEKYKTVKALRGNEPSVTNRFAYLYTQNLIPTYLEYYPEEEFSFSFHQVCVQNIVDTLLRFYMDIHVKHRVTIQTIDKMWHPHLYALHKLYLSTMKASKRRILTTDIQAYFHNQPWQRMAFLIRKIQDTYFSQVESALHPPSVPLEDAMQE